MAPRKQLEGMIVELLAVLLPCHPIDGRRCVPMKLPVGDRQVVNGHVV
jgi:hypothetical protein